MVLNKAAVAGLPRHLPPWQTVWWRFDRWAPNGTRGRVLIELQDQAHAVADVKLVVSVNLTVARSQQHAAGACKTLTGRTDHRCPGSGWLEVSMCGCPSEPTSSQLGLTIVDHTRSRLRRHQAPDQP